MKHLCAQCILAGLLLAAIAIPQTGDGAKAAGRRNPAKTVEHPTLIADAFPTPWPKKPQVKGATEAPAVIADAFPTPWPKKPSAEKTAEAPSLVADAFPTPWPKKPSANSGLAREA